MRKFLWFTFKEPHEKIIDMIMKAKEEKKSIEINNTYLFSKLNRKQREKFADWMEKNKSWLKDCTVEETELDRLQRKIPGLWCAPHVDTSGQKFYIVFNFIERG